jgi:hypothetical protein
VLLPMLSAFAEGKDGARARTTQRKRDRSMPKRSMKQDDPLEDFARREITLDGVGKRV